MADISTYTISAGDVEMMVTNFGARVMKLFTPDRNGVKGDIVLGYNTTDQYITNNPERFFGAVCGRFANRIANGKFEIEEEEYRVPINNNGQSLHGGVKGLDSVVWDVQKVTSSAIYFRYISPNGEEGYPGTLIIDMSYELTEDGEFVVKYRATTDRATIVNLTHHSYFNLRGEGCGDVYDHLLEINADSYIPIDEASIPTGELASVSSTPFDFREMKAIGRDIEAENEQLKMGSGYDHCWVINPGDGVRKAATVIDPESGRKMDVYTDQPGMQFYSGNFLSGELDSKNGKSKYVKRGALALETQLFPDTPNQPHFPSALLDEGEIYSHTCIYKFSVVS